jgi:hypothetical protein
MISFSSEIGLRPIIFDQILWLVFSEASHSEYSSIRAGSSTGNSAGFFISFAITFTVLSSTSETIRKRSAIRNNITTTSEKVFPVFPPADGSIAHNGRKLTGLRLCKSNVS